MEQYAISHAQFVVMANIMWFVEQGETPNQIMVVTLSKLDKMTVSKALKKLVLEGCVTRVEDLVDTRAKAVSLTAAGLKLVKKLIGLVEKVDGDYFSVLSKSGKNTLLKVFGKLIVG